MPTTADELRELHQLHQRAKALRDRLVSGPKTVTARQTVLARRQAELETARDTVKKTKTEIKSRETQVQSLRSKVDDLRVKLNAVKKQVEYDAIRSQIAHDNLAISKLEDETLELMSKGETQEAELKAAEAEVAKLAEDVKALAVQVEQKAEPMKAQLAELEQAITDAENVIPGEMRDQYRRVVKSMGAEGMAAVENGACTGCYLSPTAQTLNDLINGDRLVFCKTCGRILYLAEEEHDNLRRS